MRCELSHCGSVEASAGVTRCRSLESYLDHGQTMLSTSDR